MIWNLLAEESSSVADSSTGSGASNYGSLIMLVVMAALLIVFMVINRRSQKKRQEETQNMLDAIKVGTKVKTIGGICGTVVEVNAEDNTFVLETGTADGGKSYIRFDKQAVYQSDAVAEKPEEKTEETASEANTDEKNAEQEPFEETKTEE